MSAQPALDVRNLSVSFPMRGRDADGRRRRLLAVPIIHRRLNRRLQGTCLLAFRLQREGAAVRTRGFP